MSLGGGFNIPKRKEEDEEPGSQAVGGLDYTIREQKEEEERKEELLRQRGYSETGDDSGVEETGPEEGPITSMTDFDRVRELNRARQGINEVFEDEERSEFERYKMMRATLLNTAGIRDYESKVKQNDILQGTNALDGILEDMNNRINKNKDTLIEQKDFKRVENSMELLSITVFLLYGISWIFKVTVVLSEFSPIFVRGAIGLIQGSAPFMGKTKRWRSVYQNKIMDLIYTSDRQNPITFLALIKRLLKEEIKFINETIGNEKDAINNLENQAEQVVSRVPELAQYWNSNRPSEK